VPGEFELGAEFGAYRIEALVGRGGMSTVYRAEDLRLGRRVALKVLAPELARDERFRARFLAESRLAAVTFLPEPSADPTPGVLRFRVTFGGGLAAGLRQQQRLPAARAPPGLGRSRADHEHVGVAASLPRRPRARRRQHAGR
jgi:hypothetical protein